MSDIRDLDLRWNWCVLIDEFDFEIVVENLVVGFDTVEVMSWIVLDSEAGCSTGHGQAVIRGLVVTKDKMRCGCEMKVGNGINVEFAEMHSIYSTMTESIQVLDCEDLNINVKYTCTSTW